MLAETLMLYWWGFEAHITVNASTAQLAATLVHDCIDDGRVVAID
jgi:hypothetical protein